MLREIKKKKNRARPATAADAECAALVSKLTAIINAAYRDALSDVLVASDEAGAPDLFLADLSEHADGVRLGRPNRGGLARAGSR